MSAKETFNHDAIPALIAEIRGWLLAGFERVSFARESAPTPQPTTNISPVRSWIFLIGVTWLAPENAGQPLA